MLEDAIASDVLPLVSSPKVLAALFKSQPKLRETLRAALGPEPSRKVSPAEGPRALATDMVSAASTPTERPRTPQERRAAALAMLRQAQ